MTPMTNTTTVTRAFTAPWPYPHDSLPNTSSLMLDAHHTVRLECVLLDRESAAFWLNEYHYPRQRPEYPSVVRLYADMMTRSEWGVSTITLATYDGTPAEGDDAGGGLLLPQGTYLINGRNRLNAVVESGMPTTFLVEHHLMQRPADLHHLYMRLDRGKTRTPVDVYRAMGLAEALGLSNYNLRLIGEAESYLSTGFEVRNPGLVDAEKRAEFIIDWIAEGRDWISCVTSSRSRLVAYITASPVTAVAMVALRFQPAKAMEFFTAMAHDNALTQGSPEKTVHDWILETRVREMAGHHYARHVAAGWNAYYEGRTLSRIVVRDLSTPIRILGTPFTGKQPHGPLPDEVMRRPRQ
jgi:hypothetical protein